MTQRVMTSRPVEAPASLADKDMYKALEGYDVLGSVTPEYNCCTQKILGELATYFKDHKIAPALGFDINPGQVLESLPKWILYLRSGVKQGEPVQALANLDGCLPLFRNLGLETYYYLDDALFFVNNMAPLKLIWNCDKVIVATEALAEFLIENQKLPKPVYLVKTHMDIPVFDSCPKPLYLVDPKKFNILFTSQGRVGALMMHRILEEMDKNPTKYQNVNLVVVSAWVAQMRTILNQFRGIRKSYWEWMPLQEHYGLTKSVQLILAPGEEADLDGQVDKDVQHLWLHSKSCVKYTCAGAARIPLISAPLNEYEKAIKHGETGFIANTLKEWMDTIDLCINDPDLCKKVGEAARADVEEKWYIADRAKQWADTLRGGDQCLVKGVEHVTATGSNLPTQLQLSPEGISSGSSSIPGGPDVPQPEATAN